MKCKDKAFRMTERNIDDIQKMFDNGELSYQQVQKLKSIVANNMLSFDFKERQILTEREKANKYINEILGE